MRALEMHVAALAGIALALAAGPAEAGRFGASGLDTAVDACLAINDYAPAEAVQGVEDGLGDYFVWVKDVDGDFWLCNANAEGDVYVNTLMTGDLLADSSFSGSGGARFGLTDGQRAAERLCQATLADQERMEIAATVEDGMNGWAVWLEDAAGDLWLCDTAEGEIWALEPVTYPINGESGGEDPSCAPAVRDERWA